MNKQDRESEYIYKAFISYRHKPLDKKIAQKIHFALEHYKIPRELRGEDAGDRLGKVFRDEEELPATGNLSESINYALEHSEYLIVVCTPDTPKSKWVREEIARFKELHGHDHVIAVLANGTPNESFPEELITCEDPDHPGQTKLIEPLATNLTDIDNSYDKSRFKREIVRLYAAILGCPYDSLWQRERRYAMRKTLLIVSAAFAVVLAFAISMLINNYEISERNREISEKNRMIEQQNAEIIARNKEIEEANSELILKEAATLIREAELLVDTGENEKAIDSTLNAISSEEGKREYGDEAEFLLSNALGAGQFYNEMRRYSSVSLDDNITEIKISKLKDRFYSVDTSGVIRCFSYPGLDQKWVSIEIDMSRNADYYVKRARLVEIPEENILIYCGEQAITALSCDDGSLVWQNDNSGNGFSNGFAVSEDRKTLGILGSVPNETNILGAESFVIQLIDVKTGKTSKAFRLPGEFDNKNGFVSGNSMTFSKTGRYLALTFYINFRSRLSTMDGNNLCTFIVDLDKDLVNVALNEKIESRIIEDHPTVIGSHFSDDEKSIYVMDYNIDTQSVRLTQSFLNGGNREIFSHPQNQVDKAFSSAEDNLYMDMKEGVIFASYNNVAYSYRTDSGNDNYGASEEEGIILYYGYIGENNSVSLLVTNDGNQHITFSGGIAAGAFLDMKHLTDLDFTEGFARDDTDGFGYAMNSDAWGIAICEDTPQKINVLVPTLDPHIERLQIEDRIEEFSIKAAMLDEAHVAIYGDDKETEGFVIYVYDLSEKKIIKSYYIDDEKKSEMEITRSSDIILDYEKDLFFSLYGMSNKGNVWSLNNTSCHPLFDRKCIAMAYSLQNSGRKMFAGIARDEDSDYDDPTFSLLWCDGGGEVNEAKISDDRCLKRLSSKNSIPMICLGRNGCILARIFKDTESDETDSFLVYDTVGEKEHVIQDLCPGSGKRVICMGDKMPVFAVADDDGHVRVYDAEKEDIIRDLDLSSAHEKVLSLKLCKEDKELAVWSTSVHFQIFDIATGHILYDEYNKRINNYDNIKMNVTEDPDHARMYFSFTSGQCIVIDSDRHVKTAFIPRFEIYCKPTNEIWFLNGGGLGACGEINGVYKYPAYTYDELIKWANER